MGPLSTRARQVLSKPPGVVARRLVAETAVELERFRGPRRARRAVALDWDAALERPFPFVRHDLDELERRWPDERERVLTAAARAMTHEIDLLGTGPVHLGKPIEWHCDWKTGRRWPLRYGRRLDVAELDRPSDVKVPWEISRLQWLLPAGQAFLLTNDDSYAAAARDVLDDWLDGNPYPFGVNWSIAMEAAVRTFSWSWLFHACGRSNAWCDDGFRSRFLRGLYLNVDFVERNIERSDVNGNHYTADAAALVVGGLVLGVSRWADRGWRVLEDELPRQVHADGVDFEAASAYHRLVGELFALPALLRRAHGLPVADAYVARVQAMARFTRAYTGPDGLAPLWGDNDDGRALPLGGQDVRDHRSLSVLAAALGGESAPANAEGAWLVGAQHVATETEEVRSAVFRDGGVCILRRGRDHVFFDCGPVGLAGRGGHGHNDCLSFEATLAGVKLITDSGLFVYTASPSARNHYRATRAHNTPIVDGEEQNRIPESLWRLTDDARGELLAFDELMARGMHHGYERLSDPTRITRALELEPDGHRLTVDDAFDARCTHMLIVPFHFAPGVRATLRDKAVLLDSDGRTFRLTWSAYDDWEASLGHATVAPSYGVQVPVARLELRRSGDVRRLRVVIEPA